MFHVKKPLMERNVNNFPKDLGICEFFIQDLSLATKEDVRTTVENNSKKHVEILLQIFFFF